MKISTDEFRLLSAWIRNACGIALDDEKRYLVETRLGKLAEEQGCQNFSSFYFRLKNDGSGVLSRLILDRITTQETSFFRDGSPFDMLKFKILPEMIDRKNSLASGDPPHIRIWSAACSTGQEVYSIAMSLSDVLGKKLKDFRITIVGTDISDAAIAKASRGQYSPYEMQRGVDCAQSDRYFSRLPGGEFLVRDELRCLVSFRQLNLLKDFAVPEKWDVVFCRNVAIYFSEEEKKKLFDRISGSLESDGALIIGATESIQGLCPQYASRRYNRSVFYQIAKR